MCRFYSLGCDTDFGLPFFFEAKNWVTPDDCTKMGSVVDWEMPPEFASRLSLPVQVFCRAVGPLVFIRGILQIRSPPGFHKDGQTGIKMSEKKKSIGCVRARPQQSTVLAAG